jgi:hypothetical protein
MRTYEDVRDERPSLEAMRKRLARDKSEGEIETVAVTTLEVPLTSFGVRTQQQFPCTRLYFRVGDTLYRAKGNRVQVYDYAKDTPIRRATDEDLALARQTARRWHCWESRKRFGRICNCGQHQNKLTDTA